MSTRCLGAILVAAALLLSACATTPTRQGDDGYTALQRAEKSVSAAARAPVRRYALTELHSAQDSLRSARQAWVNGQQDQVRHLSYVARRLAEIAVTKASVGELQARADRVQARTRLADHPVTGIESVDSGFDALENDL